MSPTAASVGDRQERCRVDIVHERLVRVAMGCGIGVREVVKLARQRQRIGKVVASERSDLDARRSRHRQTADRVIGIAEVHRPRKSGVRFSRKAAMPSFWSSLAKSR